MTKLTIAFILFQSLLLGTNAQAQDSDHRISDERVLAMLDGNHDGIIDPYEALDQLLQLKSELGNKELTQESLADLSNHREQETEKELAWFLKEMDSNKDGKTSLEELDPEEREYFAEADENDDGFITSAEVRQFEENSEIDEGEDGGLDNFFDELDANEDGVLTKDEVEDDEEWEELSRADKNEDGKLTKDEIERAFDESPIEFEVKGSTAFMSGVIGPGTPASVLRLVFEHPGVRTIEMTECPGSMDDDSNIRAARYVRQHGFTTILRSNSMVASGGTDFFLAGKKRIVEKGARIGIHSWGSGDFEAKEVPRDDPQHQLYLKYYEEMGIPTSFYWRTLEAAPANDIHWMTEKELAEFNFRTDDEAAQGEADASNAVKATVEQLEELNNVENVASNTTWNLEQMASRCDQITINKQGFHEATFSDGHVLVFVPQGSFPMGTKTLKQLDQPVHEVGLRGYWIAKYLTTNAQFRQFVDETEFKTDAEKRKAEGPYVYNFKKRYFVPTPGRSWRDAFKECVENHPVVAVSWYDSQAYAAWLGKKLDLNISLPTEAQWEKAARGTDQRKYPWGNSPPDGSQANFCDAEFAKKYPGSHQGTPDLKANDGYAGLSPVNAFPKGASPYGVFDMGGNVSNWVNDWLGDYPNYSTIEPSGPVRGQDRCMRGGFWVGDAGLTKASIEEQHNLRSECRSADDPRSSDDHLGFRFSVRFVSPIRAKSK